jgi:site-specific DNA recombinase
VIAATTNTRNISLRVITGTPDVHPGLLPPSPAQYFKSNPTVSLPIIRTSSRGRRFLPEATPSHQVKQQENSRTLRDTSEESATELANSQVTESTIPWSAELNRRAVRVRRRGLPESGDLFKLASVYIDAQRRLWPQLVEAQILPECGDDQTANLAAQFTTKFLEKQVTEFLTPDGLKLWDALGTSYLRYSSNQQNPRSLDDQLLIQLERAKEDKVFIPWAYVFADAGVTGTVSNRTGYLLAKEVLQRQGHGGVEVIYVDEISRATRDGIETLLLGNLVQNLGKRIIAVSEGFDSREEFSKMKLHFFAMFNEQYLVQHRARVLRGKEGAARRGTVVGKLPLGIKAVPANDANGVPMRGRSGNQSKTFAIDEETRPVVELAAKRFVDDRWSLHKIVREFNQIRAAGRAAWQTASILKILRNPIYVGIYVYRRTRYSKDPITGKQIVVQNPRKAWKVKRFRNVQIFTWRRWKAIQQRLKEVTGPRRSAYNGTSRNTVYPTTLLSGMLFCGYCGTELVLYRSTKTCKNFFCRNGRTGAHGCKLTTSKSARILEEAILSHVRAQILTPERIESVVTKANEYLQSEAAKPRVDTKNLQNAAAELKRKRERLIDLVADGIGPDLAAIRSRIGQIEKQLRELNQRISAAEAANSALIAPVDLARTLSLLSDIRGLLNQDVAATAPVLRKLLGKIWVKKDESASASLKAWAATFCGNPVPLIADAAGAQAQNPDSLSWVNLSKRIWTPLPQETLTVADAEPIYRAWASQVAALVQDGMPITEAARALGIDYESARFGYHFSQDGLHRRERQRIRRQAIAESQELSSPALTNPATQSLVAELKDGVF